MLTIGFDQGPGDGVPERARLPCLPTTIHVRLHIEGAQRVRSGEGLLDVLHQ
jgi:hypothetical protein